MSDNHEALEETKQFLRLDGSYEDITVSSLLFAGEIFLEEAGIPKPESTEEKLELYTLALKLFAADNFENRLQVTKDAQNVRPSLGLLSIMKVLQASAYELEETEANNDA